MTGIKETTYALLDVSKPIEETSWTKQVREHGRPLFEEADAPKPALTPAQISAIRCAHADLQGALQGHDQGDPHVHDWDSHRGTVQELEDAFPNLLA